MPGAGRSAEKKPDSVMGTDCQGKSLPGACFDILFPINFSHSSQWCCRNIGHNVLMGVGDEKELLFLNVCPGKATG